MHFNLAAGTPPDSGVTHELVRLVAITYTSLFRDNQCTAIGRVCVPRRIALAESLNAERLRDGVDRRANRVLNASKSLVERVAIMARQRWLIDREIDREVGSAAQRHAALPTLNPKPRDLRLGAMPKHESIARSELPAL